MNIYVITAFIIPFALATGAMMGIFKKKELGKLGILPKCTTSALFLASATLALYLNGVNPFTHLIFWALVFFVLADGLLEVVFVSGVISFLAGHVCMIVWAISMAKPHWVSIILWAIAMAIMLTVFHTTLKTMKLKDSLPVIIYACVLCTEFALLVMLPCSLGSKFIFVAIGGVAFFISDIFVAKGQFMKNTPAQNVLLIILYWLSLYMTSSQLWVIL